MSTVTENGSAHQGSPVSCHACEQIELSANDLTNRKWAFGDDLHCTTCHEGGHRACEQCGACLPHDHRWDRFYCSSTCRVRARIQREQWRADHPDEVAAKQRKLDQMAAEFRALTGTSDEHIARRKRIAELKAHADRCATCDKPFDIGETIYRRALHFEGPVLPYCAEHVCDQADGHHNRDAPPGSYYPSCRCPGEQAYRHWPQPEPCAQCGRPVCNDRETASPRKFTRDWTTAEEQARRQRALAECETPEDRYELTREWPVGPVVRTFCSDGCRRTFHKAKRRRTADPRPCESCSDEFTPRRSDARYCSAACRQRAHRQRQAP